jgi:cytochrome P450
VVANEEQVMEEASATSDERTEAWYADHFDHTAPHMEHGLHDTLSYMREHHPVARSDEHGGFWAVTSYEEVLRVAQDWESFSSEHGITVPGHPTSMPAIPEQVDPPLHREFKRLINAWFTPAAVAKQEQATRDLVTSLIDGFIESGSCDFMEHFAAPLPGRVFFEMFLHAPPEELDEINRLSSLASVPTTPEAIDARIKMLGWINDFVEQRRTEPRQDDVVDAVIHAEIEGREITQMEIIGVLQLLLFGGLDTTAGALGMMMIRFCQEPEIPALLRAQPELITPAVEELLRLDGPFIFIGRTAMCDAEVGGQQLKEGDRVLVSWAGANRDEKEFACPHQFDLERESNRHIAFGAGPHRCAGSNLARMNLRIAVGELVRRLHDIRLADGAEPIRFNSAYSRSPKAVPITFTPGPRLTAPA